MRNYQLLLRVFLREMSLAMNCAEVKRMATSFPFAPFKCFIEGIKFQPGIQIAVHMPEVYPAQMESTYFWYLILK